ncbi:calcium/sodium antiporter [Aquisalimonas sp.]|uniref:calcium/sodium antiporter n=1 Tax=Aquisalimonas sp. TaxID=1872621 RepID=UPI0025B86A46|nr:calcium/sodium antiporter [Aquisalimonas sp.]
MQAIIPWLTLLAGFVVLAWSADRLVAAASALALHLGLTPVLVGLLIVGFGTSTPELLVSALAALEGQPELALGNALGSNIANVGLILGVTLVLFPLPRQAAGQGLTVLLLTVATTVTLVLLANLHLGRLEGGMLMLGLALSLAWLVRASLREPTPQAGIPSAAAMGPARSTIELLLALLVLLASARALVWAAVTLAEQAGISELVIGLSIVAVGTSLPELATTIAAARRRELGMLYGNLIGSNLFNLLAVLGVTALLQPLTIAPVVFLRDGLTMAALTLPLIVLGLGRISGTRVLGMALLVIYFSYQGLLFVGSAVT